MTARMIALALIVVLAGSAIRSAPVTIKAATGNAGAGGTTSPALLKVGGTDQFQVDANANVATAGNVSSTSGRVYSIDSAKKFMTAYPRVGKPHSVARDTANANGTILYLGAGTTGVVREFFTTYFMGGPLPSGRYNELTDNVRIRIYVGAGDVTDFSNINQSCLCADIPIALLFCRDHDSSMTSAFNYNTEFINLGVTGNGGYPSLQFKMPIPFVNGIIIQMTDNIGAPITTNYTWADYEVGPRPTGQYQNWKFRSSFSAGSMSGTRTFLNVASGSGALLGLWSSCDEDTDTMWPEYNWSFWIDGDNPAGTATWSVSGWEDIFFNAYYGLSAPGIYREYGLLKSATAPGLSAFAYLHNQNIEWVKGIVGKYPYVGGQINNFKVLTLYYGD
ncbi:DUF2961 domain-containing protein [bacterium]|nr:DUF2961 domain-containing protein [bacterium]